MARRSALPCNRTASGGRPELRAEFDPRQLPAPELSEQVALYVETTALKPLLSRGVGSGEIAEVLIELAVRTLQRTDGRLAAAVMLQRATRHAFAGTVAAKGEEAPAGRPARRHAARRKAAWGHRLGQKRSPPGVVPPDTVA